MKLASLKHARDGRLVVVSRDLAWYADADAIAPTLQAALDDWDRCEPLLRALADSLELGVLPELRFHEHEAASPLPRAYQWADGSAYVNHVALVRQARGAEMPASFWTDPLMYQGGSDGFLGPRDPIPLADPAWGCDFEAEVAVITGDVPRGVSSPTTFPCATSSRANWPSRSASSSPSRPGRFPLSPSRRTNSAPPGPAVGCMARWSSTSTTPRSAARTPAST
jgi:hypothetical protein